VASCNVRLCEGLRMPAHEGGAARTGAGVRKPPMEETAGGVARWRVRRYGDLTAVVPECEYNFCDMARTLRMGENTFRRPCKGTYYNFCVMCLMAAFVPHRPNKYCHVTAFHGIVLSSPYTPLAIILANASRREGFSNALLMAAFNCATVSFGVPRFTANPVQSSTISPG
jgi:hypothetical protein